MGTAACFFPRIHLSKEFWKTVIQPNQVWGNETKLTNNAAIKLKKTCKSADTVEIDDRKDKSVEDSLYWFGWYVGYNFDLIIEITETYLDQVTGITDLIKDFNDVDKREVEGTNSLHCNHGLI